MEADFGAERFEQKDGQDVGGRELGAREDLDGPRGEAQSLGPALGQPVALLEKRTKLQQIDFAFLDDEVLVESRGVRMIAKEGPACAHALRLVGDGEELHHKREGVGVHSVDVAVKVGGARGVREASLVKLALLGGGKGWRRRRRRG
jgi:hypothetical protein